jgi:hypothetical protein
MVDPMSDKFDTNAIPDHLYWLIGKGRNRPTEPLFAVQLIDPESGIAIVEKEAETLGAAIAAAIEALPDGHAVCSKDEVTP